MNLQLIEGGNARKLPKSYGDATPAQLVPVLNRYRKEDPAGYASLVACICGITFESLEDIINSPEGPDRETGRQENRERE